MLKVDRVASVAVLITILVLLVLAAPAAAAEPSAVPTVPPSPILIDPLDPRAGDGPSPVGAPLLALVAVIGLGVAAAGATAIFVRLTARR